MGRLFDLSDEIQLVSEGPENWHVEPEHLFYAIRACGMLAVIIPVFEAERAEKGIVITAFGRLCLHEIAIRETAVMLGSKAIDDKDARIIEHFFVGESDNPASWEGVIRHIFKAERSILQMIDFAGRVRAEWNEFLRIRQERLGF
jgi:hypothetical protein